MIKTVSVQELCEQLETDPQVVLIDVRRSEEFNQGHLPQAYNIPLGTMPVTKILDEWSREEEGKPLYLICQSGGRSQQLIDEFAAAGCENVQCVAGGMVAWQALGLPIHRQPAQTLGLFHQPGAWLGSGLLVLLGSALGLFWHPLFMAIPTLVAVGLCLAGLRGFFRLFVAHTSAHTD